MADHPRNLELKVQCPPAAIDDLRTRVESLVCSPILRLHQVDTYFHVERGRLKLREIRAEHDPRLTERAELIAYARPTEGGSRWSSYEVIPIAAHAVPKLLAGLLMTHDQLALIDKVREVAIVGHTRIHLDRVDRLGTFVELETVISTQLDDAALAEHQRIIELLGLSQFPSVDGSYSDLAFSTS